MLDKFKSISDINTSSSTIKADPLSVENTELYIFEAVNTTIENLAAKQFESLTTNLYTEGLVINKLKEKFKSKYINACIDAYIDEYFEANLLNISREIYLQLGSTHFIDLITTIRNENIKNTALTKNLLNSLKEFTFEDMGRRVNSFFLHHLINKDEEQVITVISIIENWGSREELEFLHEIKDSTIRLSERVLSYLDRVMKKLT